MQDLIKKIEAAAEARLSLPPDSTQAERLAACKSFLKIQTHRLRIEHRAGAEGRRICAARSAILDGLLRHLWVLARQGLSAQAQK